MGWRRRIEEWSGQRQSDLDPEMRHGRNSSKGRFDGYKAHIAETADSEGITGVAVTAGNLADAEDLPEMLEQQQRVEVQVGQVTGDTAYVSGDVRADMV